MKGYLCKCNNCDSILIDENAQTGAKEYEFTGIELNMTQLIEPNIVNPEDKSMSYFWACPICKTDEYLIDL